MAGLLIVGGVVLVKRAAASHWQRQSTDDKLASAEFPGKPTARHGRFPILTYNVPGQDISLMLSCEPPRDFERSTGSDNEADPVYRVTETTDANKATLRLAVAHVGGKVCRAAAGWGEGSEDRSLTDRFVRSFKVATDRR